MVAIAIGFVVFETYQASWAITHRKTSNFYWKAHIFWEPHRPLQGSSIREDVTVRGQEWGLWHAVFCTWHDHHRHELTAAVATHKRTSKPKSWHGWGRWSLGPVAYWRAIGSRQLMGKGDSFFVENVVTGGCVPIPVNYAHESSSKLF